MIFRKNIKIGNKTWAKKDLSIDDGLGGIKEINGKYYYTWEAAKRVASKISGYRLPTKQDFVDTLESCGINEYTNEYGWDMYFENAEKFKKNFGYIEGGVYEFGHSNNWGQDVGYTSYCGANYWCSDICENSPYPYYVKIKSGVTIFRNYKGTGLRIRLIKE